MLSPLVDSAQDTQVGPSKPLALPRSSTAADVAEAAPPAAGEELAAAEQSIDLQAKSLEATRRLALAGRGQTIDIARAEAQLMQLRATPPALAMLLAIATRDADTRTPREATTRRGVFISSITHNPALKHCMA